GQAHGLQRAVCHGGFGRGLSSASRAVYQRRTLGGDLHQSWWGRSDQHLGASGPLPGRQRKSLDSAEGSGERSRWTGNGPAGSALRIDAGVVFLLSPLWEVARAWTKIRDARKELLRFAGIVRQLTQSGYVRSTHVMNINKMWHWLLSPPDTAPTATVLLRLMA